MARIDIVIRTVCTVLITSFLLVGCATKKIYLPVDLSSKLPPVLQTDSIPTEEGLACVTSSTYAKIVTLHKRIATLRGIIESTRKKK